MIRTQIQLTDEQARRLKRVAQQRGISMAEATREAIESWLAASSQSSIDERRRRAVSAVGKFRSGKRDVSERHDDYLAEGYLE
jgi:predicted DNA-binding protein